jgi:hypothetical protein
VSDPLSPTFDVAVNGSTYTFRKPDIRYRIQMGYKAADTRRRVAPEAGGMLDFGIDRDTVDMSRAFAIMELYLQASDAAWPFSPDAAGKPVVDFTKFPFEREDDVLKIGAAFEAEVAISSGRESRRTTGWRPSCGWPVGYSARTRPGGRSASRSPSTPPPSSTSSWKWARGTSPSGSPSPVRDRRLDRSRAMRAPNGCAY